jgi:hypothetical protein
MLMNRHTENRAKTIAANSNPIDITTAIFTYVFSILAIQLQLLKDVNYLLK